MIEEGIQPCTAIHVHYLSKYMKGYVHCYAGTLVLLMLRYQLIYSKMKPPCIKCDLFNIRKIVIKRLLKLVL
jgi:hypothetical protein